VFENIQLIRQYGSPKPANLRICSSNIFDRIANGSGRHRPFLQLKRRDKPSNVRILLADIVTFHGFFCSESDILKPRWLLTPARLDVRFGERRFAWGIPEKEFETISHSNDS
jgi:hypothetical protein